MEKDAGKHSRRANVSEGDVEEEVIAGKWSKCGMYDRDS